MGASFTIDAHAKVNLCLSVSFPPTEDGYHQLSSVFHELPLHDTLTFEVVPLEQVADCPTCACTQEGTVVEVACMLPNTAPANATPLAVPATSAAAGISDPVAAAAAGILPGQEHGNTLATHDNLVFKAIDALEQALGVAVVAQDEALRVQVTKRIPAGGGLGGGSADAAAALRACLRLLGYEPHEAPRQATDEGRLVGLPATVQERVHAVARALGADVAFFLYGGTALMEGRGDTLVRRLPAFPLPLVLMGEEQGISTARVYRDFDAAPPSPPSARELVRALEAAVAQGAYPAGEEARTLALACANNLEPAACAALPRLGQRIERARQDPDVLNALVTGSGATSYAVCPSTAAAQRFAQRATAYCSWVACVLP